MEKSFKKCSISKSLDGTEDEFIWDSADDRASSEDDGNNGESDLIRGEHNIFLFITIAIPLIKRHRIPKCIGIATQVRNIVLPVLFSMLQIIRISQEQFNYGIKQGFL